MVTCRHSQVRSSCYLSYVRYYLGPHTRFKTCANLNVSLDYMPVYYQGCKGASPIASGVDIFGVAFTIVPAGIVSGISVARTQYFRPQLWLSWILIMIGVGLMSTLHADSSRSSAIGFPAIAGIGLGILVTSTYFPVLAPLPLSDNAHAIAFFMFCRNFGQVSGCEYY